MDNSENQSPDAALVSGDGNNYGLPDRDLPPIPQGNPAIPQDALPQGETTGGNLTQEQADQIAASVAALPHTNSEPEIDFIRLIGVWTDSTKIRFASQLDGNANAIAEALRLCGELKQNLQHIVDCGGNVTGK